MALRIRLTARATRDLEEIRAYLLERNPQGADNVRADIDRTIETLAEFPGIGRDSDLPEVRDHRDSALPVYSSIIRSVTTNWS